MLQYDLLNYTQVKYELNKQEQQTPQQNAPGSRFVFTFVVLK